MPTDATPLTPVALFLFAHQDDEFGVFERIASLRRQGVTVACAYLTDGRTDSASIATRNAESLAVLARLGVARENVAFAGELLGIGDAQLPLHLAPAAAWIGAWLDAGVPIDSLHAPAWEGGHHDHDALHALTVLLAAERGLLARTWQYSLYQANGLGGPLFRVLAPLAANGPVQRSRIGWRARQFQLRLCLSYPSQRMTWIGLFPMVLAHYLLDGCQSLQPVAPARLAERPHAGPLYYEKRRFFTWNQLDAALQAWRGSPRT
jgi:LmbE family N-acetylglucosaminyl deacetylase